MKLQEHVETLSTLRYELLQVAEQLAISRADAQEVRADAEEARVNAEEARADAEEAKALLAAVRSTYTTQRSPSTSNTLSDTLYSTNPLSSVRHSPTKRFKSPSSFPVSPKRPGGVVPTSGSATSFHIPGADKPIGPNSSRVMKRIGLQPKSCFLSSAEAGDNNAGEDSGLESGDEGLDYIYLLVCSDFLK